MTEKKQIYTIEEENFGSRRVQTFENREEWCKAIDNLAVNSVNKGTFTVALYEAGEQEVSCEKTKIFGTQGRPDRTVYTNTIPEEWEFVESEEVRYFEILENDEGKFYPSYDSDVNAYDDEDELRDIESPSQYLIF